MDVPKGMKAGQTFVLDLKQAPKLAVGARQQKLVQKLPKARKVDVSFLTLSTRKLCLSLHNSLNLHTV